MGAGCRGSKDLAPRPGARRTAWSHKFSAEFDDDNLIATAGLVPVMLLAESAGLWDLVDAYLTVAGSAGVNADVKVGALVTGMVAGADSISDMDLIRHGGMERACTKHRAPTTLGTHLRGYTFGPETPTKAAVCAIVHPRVRRAAADSTPRGHHEPPAGG